uniref:Isotrichodermin C-15 hydroxylase n=2 Tax=Talaromyces marneffei TaxID=37727 RepID=A0A093W120_TALMA
MAAAQVQLQPDIEYHPDFIKYLDRSKRRLERDTLAKTVPFGLPLRLSSSFVWDGNDIQSRDDWVFALTDNHLEELDRALSHFKASNKPFGYINRTTFPLPSLGSLLREGSRELHFGRGFFILRGIPVEKYTTEENIIIYTGVSSYVGDLRGRQEKRNPIDGKAVVLSHIKDLTGTYSRENIGGPASTNDKQVFHTDSGDIVSLFCLQRAAEGGESQLASIWQVYNILAESRPDLIHTLTNDWLFDGFNNAAQPYTARPLLYYQPASTLASARLIVQYARRYFTGFLAQPRSSTIPPITEAQAEALDALHFLGEKHSIQLDFQKGDIQYVNNLAIFHARKGFSNSPSKERHLLRLWLRDSEYTWETPIQLQDRWDEIYNGLSEEEQIFPLEPTLKNVFSWGHGGTMVTYLTLLYLWRIRYRHRLLVVSPPPTYYDGDDIGTTKVGVTKIMPENLSGVERCLDPIGCFLATKLLGIFFPIALIVGPICHLLKEQEHLQRSYWMEANAAFIIRAGSGMIASALCGALDLLLKNPATLARLRVELDAACRRESDIPMDRLAGLPYLGAVVNESLRMYPPVGPASQGAPRSAIVCGHFIPSGAITTLYALAAYGNDVNFALDASSPGSVGLTTSERPDWTHQHHLEACQPFWVGPRNCIGMSLAYVERKLVLAQLLFRFNAKLAGDAFDFSKQRVYIMREKHSSST